MTKPVPRHRRPSAALRRLCAAAGAAALLAPAAAPADIIRLKNGSRIEGRALEYAGKVVVETDDGGYLYLHRSQVARIEPGPTPREQYISRLYSLGAGDVRGHFELGLWCRRSGLFRESTEVFRRVLALDPDHPGARAELGYQRAGDRWALGQWEQVESDHFVIHFNTAAAVAAEARATLEAFHDAFTRAFCPPVRFRSVHKIRLLLFGRRPDYLEHVQETYPQLAGKAADLDRFPRAFTETGGRWIVGCIEPEEPPLLLHAVLLHESTHALLGMARDPQVRPVAWFEEGFADYLACSLSEGGAVRIGQGVPQSFIFRTWMTQAKEAVLLDRQVPLRQVLEAKAFDYLDPRMALMYAESFTLLHHLMTAESARRPQAFREYLAAAAEGQGEVGTFERVFGATVEEIEARWRESLTAYRPPVRQP